MRSRLPIALFALLAHMVFIPLAIAGARPEVRDSAPSWRVTNATEWREGRLDPDTGAWSVRVGLHGSDRVRSIVVGNASESEESKATFDAFADPSHENDLLPRGDDDPIAQQTGPPDGPTELTPQQKAQKCIADSVIACCGAKQVCPKWCGALASVECSTQEDGSSVCIVSCNWFGCEDDWCSWDWFWYSCECPDAVQFVES